MEHKRGEETQRFFKIGGASWVKEVGTLKRGGGLEPLYELWLTNRVIFSGTLWRVK